MMFAHRLTTCLLVVAALGCQTESETVLPNEALSSVSERLATAPATNLRLKQTLVSGNNGGLGPQFATAYYTYSQGHKLEKVVMPTETMSGDLTYEYTYDAQGRLSVFKVLNENPDYTGLRGTQSTFTYTDSTIVESYARVMADGQLLPPAQEPDLKTTYRVNAQGQVTEMIQDGILRFGSVTSQRFLYTYENGNLVKQIMVNAGGQAEFTITYGYDDKINPLYQNLQQPHAARLESRNNVISTSVNNNPPQLKKYTYNEQGLPLTQTYVSTGAVLTYEYETFQEPVTK